MNDFNDELRDGLSSVDEAFLRSLDNEPGMFAQMGAAFSGAMKFWTAFAFALSLTFFAVAIWAIWNAHRAESLEAMLMWLTLGLSAFFAVGLIKIWFWMRLNHLQTLRELKIISLQMARKS